MLSKPAPSRRRITVPNDAEIGDDSVGDGVVDAAAAVHIKRRVVFIAADAGAHHASSRERRTRSLKKRTVSV